MDWVFDVALFAQDNRRKRGGYQGTTSQWVKYDEMDLKVPVRKMPEIDRGGFSLYKLKYMDYRTEVYWWYFLMYHFGFVGKLFIKKVKKIKASDLQ